MQLPLRLAVSYAAGLGLALMLACSVSEVGAKCQRKFKANGPDCGTLNYGLCKMGGVNGPPFNSETFPSDNHYSCYRTCYENGENGDCVTNFRFNSAISVYASTPMYKAMKFSSPHYHHSKGIGDYRNSNLCRYHIKCDGNKLLYYSITGQTMQGRETCNIMETSPNTCVDRLRLKFPGVGYCDRCGDKNDALNANCPDRSGQGKEIIVEFIVNRETNLLGFEILANCVEPDFSQNNPPSNNMGKRHADQCTSPEGIGPRNLPDVPLAKPGEKDIIRLASREEAADSIQQVLTKVLIDNNTDMVVYRVLVGPEDRLTYSYHAVGLVTTEHGIEGFGEIDLLEVENLFGIHEYYGGTSGRQEFIGFAQLVISGNTAIMVQFGNNPNLSPTVEEGEAASRLDAAIADAVSDLEQFDVLDEIDLQEIREEREANYGSGTLTLLDDKGDLDDLALRYGNACNGVLRASACIYQQVVLKKDCMH